MTQKETATRKHLRKRKLRVNDERTIIYKDSPTGKAYIGISKRPLQPALGFGYKGVLLQTDNRTLIQCHACGKWERRITVKHLEDHKLTPETYRKKFGLLSSKALVSDDLSYMLEANGRKNILKFNLQSVEAAEARKKAFAARRRDKLSDVDEWNNRYALCEKQLGYRLLEFIKQYKILPSRGQKGEGGSIAKGLYRRHKSTNAGFKYYQVPEVFRQGTNVELLAPNGQQLFFNYNIMFIIGF